MSEEPKLTKAFISIDGAEWIEVKLCEPAIISWPIENKDLENANPNTTWDWEIPTE